MLYLYIILSSLVKIIIFILLFIYIYYFLYLGSLLNNYFLFILSTPQYNFNLISFNSYISYIVIGENVSLSIILLIFLFSFYFHSLNYYNFPNFEGLSISTSILRNTGRIYINFFNYYVSFYFNLDLVVLFFLYTNLIIFSNNFDFLSSDSLIFRSFNHVMFLVMKQWSWFSYFTPSPTKSRILFLYNILLLNSSNKYHFKVTSDKRSWDSNSFYSPYSCNYVITVDCYRAKHDLAWYMRMNAYSDDRIYKYASCPYRIFFNGYRLNVRIFGYRFSVSFKAIVNKVNSFFYKVWSWVSYILSWVMPGVFVSYILDIIISITPKWFINFLRYCWTTVVKWIYNFFKSIFYYSLYLIKNMPFSSIKIVPRFIFTPRRITFPFLVGTAPDLHDRYFDYEEVCKGSQMRFIFGRSYVQFWFKSIIYRFRHQASFRNFSPRKFFIDNIINSNMVIYCISLDVIHSLFIKTLVVKLDIFYGKISFINLKEYLGVFNSNTYLEFICYEYCGLFHHSMFSRYLVLDSIDITFYNYLFA